MTKRATKIGKAIVERMYANGGHWVELTMKNGDKLYIQRANFESWEHLDREKFNVSRNGEDVLYHATLESLAEYIDQKF